jgi:uncharacterized protein YdcH (DUF465 family)
MRFLNTLTMGIIRISDEDQLEKEKHHFAKVFKSIGYMNKYIKNPSQGRVTASNIE